MSGEQLEEGAIVVVSVGEEGELALNFKGFLRS